MKNKFLYPILLIGLSTCLLLAIQYPHLMLNPGELSKGHQKLKTECFSCHTFFSGIPAEKCAFCHTVDQIGLKTSTGVLIQKERNGNISFHQNLLEEDCTACHTDHQGINTDQHILTFSHDLIKASLRDQCRSCHLSPEDNLHQGSKDNCSQCHFQTKWIPASFDHTQYFRFDSDHKDNCESCHLDQNFQQYTCYECHEHSASKIRREHLKEGISNFENCAECHRSGDEHEAERAWRSKSSKENRSTNRKSRKRGETREHHEEKDDDDHDD
ncbi:MAG: cytochrome c3 family protein [SAR324 cluster bacterium]|nr:cytochrome c3 family protein [SAR324 cluster bacterium]